MNYDACIINDELDLLEIRLCELWDAVDVFLIVEGEVTFSGMKKRCHFKDSESRFRKWKSKIMRVSCSLNPMLPKEHKHWYRERFQRELLRSTLLQFPLGSNDLITLSDADEIPSAKAFSVRPGDGVATLGTKNSYWYMNCVTDHPVPNRAKLVTGEFLKEFHTHEIRYTTNHAEVIPNGGWHFAWLGSPERLIQKTRSYSHFRDEFVPGLQQKIILGLRPGLNCSFPFFFENGTISPVEIDSTFPKYVVDNQEELSRKGYIYNGY